MNGFVLLFLILLAVGLSLVLWRPLPPSPHREAEERGLAALPAELRRRMERYIERRAGVGAVGTGRMVIVLLATFLGAGALLFPFFSLGAVVPAAATAWVVGELYLQTQEARRTGLLEAQTLDLLTTASASLSAARLAPAKVIGELLSRAEAPLREEVSPILAPLQAGKNFLPVLEDVMDRTRSARLRRFLHLWRASEEEALGPAGQAERLRALFEQERLMESLRREVLISVRRVQFSMYVVIAIIPLLVLVMMLLVPDFRSAYTTPIGRFGLALILLLEFGVVVLSRRIVRQALRA